MKKELKIVDEKKGIIQVTCSDERWYSVPSKNETTGLPEYKHYPSVSWILGYYPKGKMFENWLKKNGDDSELIKNLAAEKGSRIHHALEVLIAGKELKATDQVMNGQTEQLEELSGEEWGAIVSFKKWVDECTPKFLSNELTVLSEKYGFGGTVDCVAQIGEEVYIIDFKTGPNLYTTYALQVAAYKQALLEMGKKVKTAKLAILQIGYPRNRNGYKFTPVPENFPLFQNVMEIWRAENGSKKPSQKDYPLSISLTK